MPTGTERVMIVDDEGSIVRMASRMLERLGYTVKGFTNSTDALTAFQSAPEQFDILLTDQTMPKMNGYELAMEIRKIKPEIAIVMMTGFSGTSAALSSVPLSEHVGKPLMAPELALKIRHALQVAVT
jgi:CheY-like chemotaxis protein